MEPAELKVEKAPSRDLVFVRAWCDKCDATRFFSLKSRRCYNCNALRKEKSTMEMLQEAINEA
jgi:thioredoxin-related protein